ncbi:MAG: hypothetical protein HKP41_06315 [Desulfobacterales bacterium]|nr:hypothetical protein [Desulfobacterales bacterium]
MVTEVLQRKCRRLADQVAEELMALTADGTYESGNRESSSYSFNQGFKDD